MNKKCSNCLSDLRNKNEYSIYRFGNYQCCTRYCLDEITWVKPKAKYVIHNKFANVLKGLSKKA
ncbi:Uncharacterised protein [Mycoplasmopsis caviae]|uniref:Uncharacterized protein n=1 Tax=Mycoplasmopsis caviae TaxID=55603 RepID=A0A3P8KCR2_9BACT|nr:Uncharacterised protein [Mycoplasmopsis caviae]